MSAEVLNELLDQAVTLGNPNMVLTGGEPLTYPDLDTAFASCQERGLPLKIATNGTLLDEPMVDRLTRYGIKSLQVSLDTLDAEVFSQTKGVPPHLHAQVLEGIDRLLEAGRFHVAISAVSAQDRDPKLSEVLRYCHDRGVNTFTVYHLIPYGKSPELQERYELEFLETLDGLFEQFSQLPQHWAVDLGVPAAVDSPLQRKWADTLDIAHISCIAGRSSLTVLTDGTAVPCVCTPDARLAVGNVMETSLSEIWEAPLMSYFRGEQSLEGCEGCAVWEACQGGCRALALLSSGSLAGPDPSCSYWRAGV
jgi:radical SAM protein with 4Fe4S-binding SPASM domain